jgi:hypothetical protein
MVVLGDAPAGVTAGITILRELGPANARLARFTDHVILLRPDRYVAACIAVDDLAGGADRVSDLIEGTY